MEVPCKVPELYSQGVLGGFLPPTSWVTLGKSFNLSESHLPHLPK